MKTFSKISLLAVALSGSAMAADFSDYAQVVSSTPMYDKVNEPKRECWIETITPQAGSSASGAPTGAIIGGIAGGILGNQVGKGSGKDIATALGAITGAVVGDRMQGNTAQAAPTTQSVERCRLTDHWVQRLTGYSVTWRYAGREFTSVMPSAPGNNLRVQIQVTPANW
jgi:uncharacterized protein YcfJ